MTRLEHLDEDPLLPTFCRSWQHETAPITISSPAKCTHSNTGKADDSATGARTKEREGQKTFRRKVLAVKIGGGGGNTFCGSGCAVLRMIGRTNEVEEEGKGG